VQLGDQFDSRISAFGFRFKHLFWSSGHPKLPRTIPINRVWGRGVNAHNENPDFHMALQLVYVVKRRDRDGETLAEIGRSYNVSGWTISRLTP
jgi:hypothetical protein